jgi:hypothetical protein
MEHSLTLGQKIATTTYCLGCRQIQNRYFEIKTLTPDPIHTFKCGLPIPLHCKGRCEIGHVNHTKQIGHLCMCRYCRFDSYLTIDDQFPTKVLVARILDQFQDLSLEDDPDL